MNKSTQVPTRVAELSAQSSNNCRVYALSDNTQEAVFTSSSPIMTRSVESESIANGEQVISLYEWSGGVVPATEVTVGAGSDERLYAILSMPTLPRSPHIKRAILNFRPTISALDGDGSPRIGLFQSSSWSNPVNGRPATYELYDYEVITADKEIYSFDVTPMIEKMSSTIENINTNICLRLMDDVALDGVQFTVSSDDISLSVIYEQCYGVDIDRRTFKQDMGFFGRGGVDLITGSLMLEMEDFAWAASKMPLIIKHQYNSALAGYQYTNKPEIGLHTADFSAMNLGKGWRLNLMQSMVTADFVHNGTLCSGYIYVDENGEETHFIQSSEGKYKDILDSGLEYDSSTRKLTRDDETYSFDDAGRLFSIVGGNYGLHIFYEDNRIIGVGDGVGRMFGFTYNGDYLTKITAIDGSVKEFSYLNGNLTNVDFPSGRATSFDYMDNEIQEIALKDSNTSNVYKSITYVHSPHNPHYILESGASVWENNREKALRMDFLNSISSYGAITTTVEGPGSDEENVYYTHYTFDADGDVVGEYSYTDVDGVIHPLADGNATTANVNNLLRHHDFYNRDGGVWKKNNTDFYGSGQFYEPKAQFAHVYCMECMDEARVARGIYQQTVVLPAGRYTLSTYMRTRYKYIWMENAGAYIRVTDLDGNVLAESEHIANTFDEYTRLLISFELEEDQAVLVHLLGDGRGGAYFCGVQLEHGDCANDYNHLKNNSFEVDDYWWVLDAGAEYTDAEHLGLGHSLKILGDLDSQISASQFIPARKFPSTRETFVLSGWGKSNGLPERDRENAETPIFRLRAQINYTDGGDPDVFYADFSPRTNNWHRTEVEFAKTRYAEVEGITVACEYGYNSGTAYFDDIQLVRTSLETDLQEADFLVETEEETATANETEETETLAEFSEVVDSHGNPITETTFTDGEFGTIYRSFGYHDSICDLTSETDARGNQTTHTIDINSSRIEETTDRCGNKTAYEYDDSGRTTKVTNKTADGTEIANVSYTYNPFDELSTITRGDGMKYLLGYTPAHELGTISVDGYPTPLMTYAYKAGSGRLKQVTYANGYTMKLTYNSDGQAVAEKWYDANETLVADYRYAYDGTGNLVRSVDILSQKEYTYIYENGRIIRATEATLTFDANLTVIGKTLLHSIWYAYDLEGNLIRKRLVNADNSVRVIEYENTEDGNPIVKFEAGGKTVLSHSKSDSFGRKEFEELKFETGFVSRHFEYLVGAVTEEHVENQKLKTSPTTQLVDRIVLSDGRTISYEYDAEERITKVTDSVDGVTEYTYDALGQLLTETRGCCNPVTVNAMTYDSYGNILTKNGKAYTYDTVWKDLLSSYDGQTITYDAQGNPTNYLGHVLSWEKGRQLKAFDGNSYTYNANGIRTSKTINGVKHEYVLDGANILKETWGSNTLAPLYDNEDSVCGILYNNVPYYFFKNLQGDIIEIVDKDCEVVARYMYDAWGKLLSIADTDGNAIVASDHIANINPYRYRGYYYDAEIGMYYLQSRYYDPVVGRFINADDAEYISVLSVTKRNNLYNYCENEPVNNVDRAGDILQSVLFKIFAGVICGLLVQLFSDLLEYFFQVIVKGKQKARFVPCVGEYVSSVIDWTFDFLNPFKSAKVVGSAIRSFTPFAVKYGYKVIRGSTIDWVLFWSDLIFATLSFIIDFALGKASKNRLKQIKRLGKGRKHIHAEKIAIRKTFKAAGQKIQFRIDIAEAVVNVFYKFIMGLKG